MAGKIKKMIDIIIQDRSHGNPAIAEMTKAKLLLKGINPKKFTSTSPDDPIIIENLLSISKQLNYLKPNDAKDNIKSVYSQKAREEDVVSDIADQLNGFGVKTLLYFTSTSYNQDKISQLMQNAFKGAVVFGCSTAGEITSGKVLKNSLVAMAFNSNIFSDIKLEVVDLNDEAESVEQAFISFENYYNEYSFMMDSSRYLGLILIDGMSMKEEKVMDLIGNRTNVYFIGASAADDMKFSKTFIHTDGKAMTNSALLVLLKMNEYAEFDIIKTQSFNVLDQVLVATKVNVETREVIEFNNKPAVTAYTDAVGVSETEASDHFMVNPVGLVLNENEIFVRSPREIAGTNIKFYCNLLEGMEVHLLESTNIIDDTKQTLDNKKNELGRIDGIINFDCIKRSQILNAKNLTQQYGAIFNDIPTVGFSTYGEQYIGHMNQTSTMIVFKYCNAKSLACLKADENTRTESTLNDMKHTLEELLLKNRELHRLVQEKDHQLEDTTASLVDFNSMLEDEIYKRTKREEEIRFLSYHDMLTGLYNRRFYEEELQKIDTENNLPISIIMGDVNGLKMLNDAFGHAKGDELLLKAAAGIKNVCREQDIAARWGGDEFVILLPKTDKETAMNIVENIKAQYLHEEVGNLQVSVSFGWETKNNAEEDISKVLKRAEDFMYDQKIIENELLKGNVINTFNKSLFEKNQVEKQHSDRVGEICQWLGQAVGMSVTEVSKLRASATLHDIGKIAIDEKILQKPGSLTKQEWEDIKRHSEIGYRIFNSTFNVTDMAHGILSHHERWDGTGYPRGLKGKDIPLLARMIALADSYDAMTSDRPYRKAMSATDAVTEIIKSAGTQFDPELAKIFVEKVLQMQWTQVPKQ